MESETPSREEIERILTEVALPPSISLGEKPTEDTTPVPGKEETSRTADNIESNLEDAKENVDKERRPPSNERSKIGEGHSLDWQKMGK